MAAFPIISLAIVWVIINLNSKIWSFIFWLVYIIYAMPLTLHFIPKPIQGMVSFAHFNYTHMRPLLESNLPIYLKNDRHFPIYATSEVILYTPDETEVRIITDMDYFTSKENPHDKFIVVTRIPEDFGKHKMKWIRIARKISKYDLEDYCMFSGWHCFPTSKKDYHKIEALYEEMDHDKIEAEIKEKEKAKGISKKEHNAYEEKKEQTVRENMQDKTDGYKPITKWDFYEKTATDED